MDQDFDVCARERKPMMMGIRVSGALCGRPGDPDSIVTAHLRVPAINVILRYPLSIERKLT